MTTMTTFEMIEVPLGGLDLHPQNVRAQNGEAYSETSVAALAANIREVGLLQPLLVQALGKKHYGVLAGGRRLAALKLLAGDRKVKGFTAKTAVPCRLVPGDASATTALSLSENELVAPMDAIDRYEAFVALQETDGLDIAGIARMFGQSERSVREVLRIGLVHGDIRSAHRAGKMSLETLKAFAGHPDPAVQLDVFEALSGDGQRVEAWQVKRALGDRGVRQGDALGAFVKEAYRAADGGIAPDLIEEDSVLSDPGLVQKVLAQKLDDLAEEERDRLGFAWAEHRVDPGWDAFEAYGRVYPQPVALDDETQAKVDEMSARLDALAAEYESVEDWDEQERLEGEHEALQAEIDGVTTGFQAEDAAKAGVIAVWQHGGVRFMTGLVRPEDMPSKAAAGEAGTDDGATAEAGPKISAKLGMDMAHVRTRAVGLALAQSPDLARDYAEFTLIRGVCGGAGYGTNTATISASVASRGPVEPDGSLAQIETAYETLHGDLDVDWLGLPGADSFAAFRALPVDARGALLAWAVAQTLEPRTAPDLRDAVRETVEREALPNIRDVWTPDEAFLTRLTKPDLLEILRDVGLRNEAKVYESGRKSNLVDYASKLFAEPFATLTPSQHAAVTGWAPELMAHVPVETEDAVDDGEEADPDPQSGDATNKAA